MLAIVRRLPLEELLPALGLLLVATLAIGPRPILLGVAWLAAVAPRLIAIDLAEHRLPDAIVLRGYPVVLAAVLLDAWFQGVEPAGPILAGLACGLVFLLLHAAGGMGLGDVKLAPLLGALVAYTLPGGAPVWLVLAFLLGGIGATVVLIRRGAGRPDALRPADARRRLAHPAARLTRRAVPVASRGTHAYRATPRVPREERR